MGWFDEQIRLRKLNDEEMFEDAFLDMAEDRARRQSLRIDSACHQRCMAGFTAGFQQNQRLK